MVKRTTAAIVIAGCVTSLVLACAPPDFEGDAVNPGNGQTSTPTQEENATSCAPPPVFAAEDPEKLPKCACANGGKARCVAKEKLASRLASKLEGCTAVPNGVCLPDPLVKSGVAPPTTCQTTFGEGRCLNLCMPEVAGKATLLTRGNGDVCTSDERCVPCSNPLEGGAPTGACDIGNPHTPAADCSGKTPDGPGTPTTPSKPAATCPYEGPPLVDVATFPRCGDGARCVPENLVSEAQRPLLKRCATGLCAPEKSIAAAGQYLPKTCRSIADAEGRCLNVNIPAVEAQAASLPNVGCDGNERCVPCFSPLDSRNTGACRSVTCDAPKEAGVRFRDCCIDDGVALGKCVPRAMIPPDRQDKLEDSDENCRSAELCAPSENLDPTFVPPTCNAFNLLQGGDYSGVCISNCVPLNLFELLGTSQGNCSRDHTCAPCFAFGDPTGVPGCPQ